MIMDEIVFTIFLTCLVLLGVSLIALQMMREEIFSRSLKVRGFKLDQSWYSSTQKTMLDLQDIWGKSSREMCRHQELKSVVVYARTASVIMYLSSAGLLVTMIVLTIGY